MPVKHIVYRHHRSHDRQPGRPRRCPDQRLASHSTNLKSYIVASPATHVSADAPPFFVLHGRNDSLVPVEQARGFVARLREVSRRPVVYAELPFTQHAFDMLGSVRAAHAAVAVEQFLAEIYATQHQAVVRQRNASIT